MQHFRLELFRCMTQINQISLSRNAIAKVPVPCMAIAVSPADVPSRREACPTGQGGALPIACFQCFTVVYGRIVVVWAIAII